MAPQPRATLRSSGSEIGRGSNSTVLCSGKLTGSSGRNTPFSKIARTVIVESLANITRSRGNYNEDLATPPGPFDRTPAVSRYLLDANAAAEACPTYGYDPLHP